MASTSRPASQEQPFPLLLENIWGSNLQEYDLREPFEAVEKGMETLTDECAMADDDDGKPGWISTPFGYAFYNEIIAKCHFSNISYVEFKNVQPDNPLHDCWPSASFIRLQPPFTPIAAQGDINIPPEEIMIPVFLDRADGLDPQTSQFRFVDRLLLAPEMDRPFYVTIVISGITLRLWRHDRLSAVPSQPLSLDTKEDVALLYRLLWRIAVSH